MNLFSTIEIYGGGPGSGCNPEVGECGRPAGKNELNLYHGTITKSAAKILKEGLLPKDKKKYNLRSHDMGVLKHKNEYGYVFLSSDPNIAKIFAEFRAAYEKAKPGDEIPFGEYGETILKTKGKVRPNAEPAIVQLHVPEKIAKDLKNDPKSPGGLAWRYSGKIPEKYIADVFVQKGHKWTSAGKDLKAQGGVDLYLVYFGDLALLKRHLNGEDV